MPWSKKHAGIVGVFPFWPANWWYGSIEDIPDFDIQTKLQELPSYADEDTFENVLNEFPERYTMGVSSSVCW